MKLLGKKRLILILGLLSTFIISLTFLLSSNFVYAEVGQEMSGELFMPFCAVETNELFSPSSVACDGENFAVIEGQTVRILFRDGEVKEISQGFASLKQIKFFNSNELLVSNDGSLYKISTETCEVDVLIYSDGSIKTVGGNYFDFNGKYLITAYNSTLQIYSVTGGAIEKITSFGELSTLYPIAINENDEIFYVDNNSNLKICKIENDEGFSLSFPDGNLGTVYPTQMIANNTDVYWIEDKSIKKVNIESKETVSLYADDGPFDLGQIKTPQSLAFLGENVLVCDSENNSITEFKIIDDYLEFTGFAIASGKTAFNRIATPVKMSKYKNSLAVLDQNKITVIKSLNENTYGKDNFVNIETKNITADGNIVSIALGENSLCTAVKDGDDYSIYVFSINGSSILTSVFRPYFGTTPIIDVTYNDGCYYALTMEDTSKLIRIDYASESEEIFTLDTCYGVNCKLRADNLSNLYVYNPLTESIDKLLFSEDYAEKHVLDYIDASGLKDFGIDFALNLFVLKDDVYFYNGETETEIKLDDVFDAFAFDCLTSDVIAGNDQSLYTVPLPIMSLRDIELPDGALDSFTSARDISSIKEYLAIENAPTYLFKPENGELKFLSEEKQSDYLLALTSSTLVKKYEDTDLSVDLIFLIDNDQTGNLLIRVIYGTETLNNERENFIEDFSGTAFITAKVCAYALPYITLDSDFAIYNTEKIYCEKESVISTIKRVDVLGKKYYYANIGNGVKAYIPETFTAKILSKDFIEKDVKVVSVENCTVYSDADKTSEITNLLKGSKIIFVEDGTMVKIAFKSGDNFVEGFIEKTAIIEKADNTLRNILIVLSVTVCVLITVIFIVYRKNKT